MLDAPNRDLHLYRKADYPQIGSDDTWTITSRGDDLWFGTYDAGVHRMQADGRITRWAARDGLPSDTILSLAFDAAGALWVATDNGLGRIVGGHASSVPLPGVESQPLVYTVTPMAARCGWRPRPASGATKPTGAGRGRRGRRCSNARTR